MSKRFLSVTVLVSAVLFSQGGNLFVATLCPHLSNTLASCGMEISTESQQHHGVTEKEEVSHPETPHQGTDAFTTHNPAGVCSHCVVHSQTNPTAVRLREAEVLRRMEATVAVASVSGVQSFSNAQTAVIPSRAHGPPGNKVIIHLLLNTFRI